MIALKRNVLLGDSIGIPNETICTSLESLFMTMIITMTMTRNLSQHQPTPRCSSGWELSVWFSSSFYLSLLQLLLFLSFVPILV